jgi:ADP-ribose pyrophosphatase
MTEPDSPSDADGHLREHAVRREKLLTGKFLQVVRDTVRLPDGGESYREFVMHPGAVAIVALLDDGQVVLERQYRHPVGRVMIEFPAGKLNTGEDARACAQRELLEETGYTAREWVRAGTMHPCIGYADEAIEIWFARGLALGSRQLDEGEFLDVITAAPAELLAWCRQGLVTDGKTLSCVLWLQNVLSGDWVLDWGAQSVV